jgi:hypothetical protein
MGSEWKAIP